MKRLEGYHCRRIPFLGLIGSVNFCLVLRESGLEEIIATYRQQVLNYSLYKYRYSSYSFFPSLRKVFGFQYTDFKREFENIFVHAGLSHIISYVFNPIIFMKARTLFYFKSNLLCIWSINQLPMRYLGERSPK